MKIYYILVPIFVWTILRVRGSPLAWNYGQNQFSTNQNSLNYYNSQQYDNTQNLWGYGQDQNSLSYGQPSWGEDSYKPPEEEEEDTGVNYILVMILFLIPILYDTLNPPSEDAR